MLLHRITGDPREVDVVVRSHVAGYPFVLSVEATTKSRRLSVADVEQLLKKHEHLATDKLVIVSRAGFAKSAIKLAESSGVVALSPTELSPGDDARRIFERASVPSVIKLEVIDAWMALSGDAAGPVVLNEERLNWPLQHNDGSPWGSVREVIAELLFVGFQDFVRRLDLEHAVSDREGSFETEFGAQDSPLRHEHAGLSRPVFAAVPGRDPVQVISLGWEGIAHTARPKLRHERLDAQRAFAHGTLNVGDTALHVVITEGAGEPRVSVTGIGDQYQRAGEVPLDPLRVLVGLERLDERPDMDATELLFGVIQQVKYVVGRTTHADDDLLPCLALSTPSGVWLATFNTPSGEHGIEELLYERVGALISRSDATAAVFCTPAWFAPDADRIKPSQHPDRVEVLTWVVMDASCDHGAVAAALRRCDAGVAVTDPRPVPAATHIRKALERAFALRDARDPQA